MIIRSLAFCAMFAFSVHTVSAQQDNDKRVFDNFDVAPRAASTTKTTEKPMEKGPEESSSTNAATDKSTKNSRSTRNKPAILKSVTTPPKGEGYFSDEALQTTTKPAPTTPAKIYSELHTSINDDGRLMLTSDTIVVKAEVKTVAAPLGPMESTGNQDLDNIIMKAGRKHQVDPRLIMEVIRQESGFHIKAMSNKGAQGLMQLIPATAARMGVSRIYDPEDNINGGTKYLRYLLDTFNGNIELALAGYNAGEYAVIRNNNQIPKYRETRDYVRSITARYRSKYHQVVINQTDAPEVHQIPLMTFAAEDGRVVLSNNY